MISLQLSSVSNYQSAFLLPAKYPLLIIPAAIKNANEIITSFMDYEALLPYLIAAAKFILLSAKNKGIVSLYDHEIKP